MDSSSIWFPTMPYKCINKITNRLTKGNTTVTYTELYIGNTCGFNRSNVSYVKIYCCQGRVREFQLRLVLVCNSAFLFHLTLLKASCGSLLVGRHPPVRGTLVKYLRDSSFVIYNNMLHTTETSWFRFSLWWQIHQLKGGSPVSV